MAICTTFKNARVLVTGGGNGMGKILACGAAQRGADVTIWDMSAQRGQAVRDIIRDHGCRAEAFVVDVTDRAGVAAAAEQTGPIDILINNAGVVGGRPLLEASGDAIERVLQVNLHSLFWVTRAFLPGMRERDHGAVVTVSSAAGLIAPAKMSDYSASKFGAIGFNEALRNELRHDGVHVNTVVACPFYMNTGMFEGVKTRFPKLLPILDPAAVAIRILNAVETGAQQVIEPPLVRLVPALRLLPPHLFDAVAEFLGVNATMDDFQGRTGDRV